MALLKYIVKQLLVTMLISTSVQKCMVKQAYMEGNAQIGGDAKVLGHANVCDEAMVGGNAEVRDSVRICEKAGIGGNALVCENARVLWQGTCMG